MRKLTRTGKTTARPSGFPPVLPLLLLSACGDGGDGSTIGVGGTSDGPDVIVNAVTEDVFTVGSVSGDDWEIFGSVQSVHFDDQANLHIFDDQAQRILVVGPDGSPIRTVGGRGEGPGEFNDVYTAIVARDGSYTVMGFSQIDLFEPTGEFARRIDLDPMATGRVIADQALPDGRLLTGVTMSLGDDDGEAEGGHPIHIFPLDDTEPELLYTAWRLPEEDEEDTGIRFGVLEWRKVIVSGSGESGERLVWAAGRAFEPPLSYDVLTDGRLALIDSIGYRVKLIGLDGNVAGTIERPIAPLAVDDAIREAERERYRERMAREDATSTNLPIEIEMEEVEGLTFADEVPVLYGLKVDWEDQIWIERRGPTGAENGPIDIVKPDGDYVGTVPSEGLRTPDAFGPGGLMAYIELDEMDVPTVRVVRLVALETQG